MPELSFSSNADEIRFYVKKLLGDYREHNRKEINSYIRRTPNGHIFTDAMITGALKTLVDTERDNYRNARRGWYCAINPNKANCKESYDNNDLLTKRVNSILDETISKLTEACTFNLLEVKNKKMKLDKVDKISELIDHMLAFEENLKKEA